MSKYMRSRHVPLEAEEPEAVEEAFEDFSTMVHEVGHLLRELRQQKGWSRSELAEKVGVDSSQIAQMEKGEQKIPVVIAKRFGEIFETSYHIFV